MTDLTTPRHSLSIDSALSANSASTRVDMSVAHIPSFEELYETYFDVVWRNARALGVPSSVRDDLVQEVFVVVHKKLATFEGRSSVRTWILGILIYAARNYRRKEKHHIHGEPLSPELLDTAESPAEHAERMSAERTFFGVLDSMREEQRTVFVLAEIEQLSIPEIAASLSINLNTAYSRLRLAREQFNKKLALIHNNERGLGHD